MLKFALKFIFGLFVIVGGLGVIFGDNAVQSSDKVPALLADKNLPKLMDMAKDNKSVKEFSHLIEVAHLDVSSDPFAIRTNFYRDYRDRFGDDRYESMIEDTPVLVYGTDNGGKINRFQINLHSKMHTKDFSLRDAIGIVQKFLPGDLPDYYQEVERYRFRDDTVLYCMRSSLINISIEQKLDSGFWTIQGNRRAEGCEDIRMKKHMTFAIPIQQ